MRIQLVMVVAFFTACGSAEELPRELCVSDFCLAVEAPSDALTWNTRELWMGVDPRTGELETRTITLRSKAFQPVRYEVQIDGPFRLEPATAFVPSRGEVTFVVHFEGEGLADVVGALHLPRQPEDGLVVLHGEGTLSEQENTRCMSAQGILGIRDAITGRCTFEL